MNLAIIASTFVIIFFAELPDKTMMSSLIMGSKMTPRFVFLGASIAFLIQVIIAVTVGGFVSRIPQRPLAIIVGIVFFIGALLIVREIFSNETEKEELRSERTSTRGIWAQVLVAFSVTFIGEFGDLTQIATANLAAKTADPISVGIGSYFGLLAITAIGIGFGAKVLSKIPIRPIQIASAAILTVLGLITILGT